MPNGEPTNQNQVPANLPIGGPPGGKRPEAREPEDILSEIEAAEPVIKGPAQPTTPPPEKPTERAKPSIPPAVKMPEKPVTKEPFFKAHKKAFIAIILILVAGGALAVGGWYAYQVFVVSPTPAVVPGVNTGQPQVDVNQPVVNQNLNVNEPAPQPVDTDRDGLGDEEEEMYGTDPQEIDSDKDGLTDRDEVKVFKTDPNNADTDGDSYLDGQEVRGGYDPKGPGRLLKVE
jgi:hypothetical protein